MAKKVLNISKFFGGINNNSNPRDIGIEEFNELQGLITTKLGTLSILGVFEIDSFSISDNIVLTNGYGLDMINLDRDKDGNINNTYYLIIAGNYGGDKKFFIYDENGNLVEPSWHGTTLTNGISVGSTINSFKPISFTVDGYTRLINSNIDEYNNTYNKWFGYINHTFFDFANQDSVDDFIVEYMDLEKPQYGSGGNELYCADISAGSSSSNPVSDGDIRIELQETSTTATDGWSKNNIDAFYATYIYNDGQESSPTWIYGDIDPTTSGSRNYGFSSWTNTNVQLKLNVLIKPPIQNKRITGIRIYTDSGERGKLYLLATIDFTNGIIKYNDSNNYYGEWTDNTGATIITTTFDQKPQADTYQSVTGITKLNLTSTNSKIWYTTNTIVNRINYVANVKIKEPIDESILSDIKTKTYNDSIFKSYVNKFDTFTSDRRLDIAINDGENIIKLASYADRLLEFKENTLYIINIAQNIEFLESVHKFRGVKYQYHVVDTEFGVAFMNEYGLYLYDGKQIVDLLSKKGIRRISIDYWNTIFNNSKSILTYDPKTKRLIVISDGSIQQPTGLLIDLNTFTIVYSNSLNLSDSGTFYAMSNGVVDWNNNVIVANSNSNATKIYHYALDGINDNSNQIMLITKDIQFDNIELKKNVYKLLLSWNPGGSTDIYVSYRYNLLSTWNTLTHIVENSTDSLETEIEFDPILEDIRSLQLKINGTVGSDFELNDISIVYRPKGVI